MLVRTNGLNNIFDDVIGWNTHPWDFFDSLLPKLPVGTKSPEIRQYRTSDKMKYGIDLPGINKDSLSVSLDGNYLKIEAERKDEFYSEKFSASIKIPVDVNMETMDASIKNGVLQVSLDLKSKEELHPTPKQIEVKSIE